jgi:Phage major capsid protein E
MASIDIFNNDAFKLQTMLPAIEGLDYLPQRLGQLEIFTPTPVRTAKVSIESRDGHLSVIPTSLRGAPLEQRTTEKRNIREFKTVRIAKGDRINADELADIRAFGTETETQAVQAEINRRLAGPMGLISDIELILENMRLGCIQNEVRDADGTKIYNWIEEFNITVINRGNEWDFQFSDAGFNQGGVREMCTKIARVMAVNSKGAWRENQSQIHALCGDGFWDALIKCAEVRSTFLNWEAAASLRDSIAYGSFSFGGVIFENYRGLERQGSNVVIQSNKAAFFPVNAPGVFLEVFAPGESFEDLGLPGQRVYPKIIPDKARGFWADLEVYCYPLHVCTRPAMLQTGWAV